MRRSYFSTLTLAGISFSAFVAATQGCSKTYSSGGADAEATVSGTSGGNTTAASGGQSTVTGNSGGAPNVTTDVGITAGGTSGGTTAAGGSESTGAGGAAGAADVECTPDATRPCSEGGLFGACADGIQTCGAEGVWGGCDIQPADMDTCDPGDDSNCNGVPNDGCGCLQETERSCAVAGALGNCAAGVQVCGPDGVFDSCDIEPAAEDSCDIAGDDADCDGTPNGNCPCTSGEVRSCGPETDAGICEFGQSDCVDGAWQPCVGAVLPSSRDCSSSADNDCDGAPDNTIDEACKCIPDSTEVCGEHPGLDGNGRCRAGERVCLAGADDQTSSWGACTGSVGPAGQDLCNVSGDDSDCDGVANSGCDCLAGERDDCGAVHGSRGVCASLQLTCRQDGTWPSTSMCGASSAEVCSSNGQDEDCDGTVNEGCNCTNGQTRVCGDCGLGSQTCSNGNWGVCGGVDYTVEDCGPDCIDCTQPNATAVCGGSQCSNTCDGRTFPSRCTTAEGKPSCGSWDFESGETEGWRIINYRDLGASNLAAPSAWNGTLTTSTTHASKGERSLMADFAGDGSNRSWLVFNVTLCSGQTVDLTSLTLSFDLSAETTSGSNFNPNNTEVLFSWFPAAAAECASGVRPPLSPNFATISCDFAGAGGADAVTDVGFAVRVLDAWTGRIYIDNVRFD